MKTLLRAAVLGLLIFSTAGRSLAEEQRAEAVIADALIARPLWFVVTAVGSALFVVTLPISAISRSIPQTADALVRAPARATFTRPLGDFSSID